MRFCDQLVSFFDRYGVLNSDGVRELSHATLDACTLAPRDRLFFFFLETCRGDVSYAVVSWITPTKRTSPVSTAKSLLDIGSQHLHCGCVGHTAECLLAGHIAVSSACAVVCSVHSCRNTSLVLRSRWATRNCSLCKPATAATLADGGPTWRTRATCAFLSGGLHLTSSRQTTLVVYACVLKQDGTCVTLEVSRSARFTIKGRVPILGRPSLLRPCCS